MALEATNVGALDGQRRYDRPPDTARPSSDDRDASVQLSRCRPRSFGADELPTSTVVSRYRIAILSSQDETPQTLHLVIGPPRRSRTMLWPPSSRYRAPMLGWR
jgi:hypothetical protein